LHMLTGVSGNYRGERMTAKRHPESMSVTGQSQCPQGDIDL
jgi:hypothetical protein